MYSNSTVVRVDFSSPHFSADTHPVECIIGGTRLVTDKWSSMYVEIVEYLLRTYDKPMNMLRFRAKDGSTRPFISPTPPNSLACAKLSNGKYICTHYSALGIITLIGNLLDVCLVKKETVVLSYKMNSDEFQREATVPRAVAQPRGVNQASVNLTEEEREALCVVLEEKFANGFAYSSTIQVGRLRKFVTELLGKELSLTNDGIVAYLKQSCAAFDGKIYIVSVQTKEQIRQLVDSYLESGVNAIFFEALFDKDESWLMELSVVSAEMLKGILLKLYPSFKFTEAYFGQTAGNIGIAVTDEILRVWRDGGILTYQQLADSLPFIPYWRISRLLAPIVTLL